MSNTDNSKNVMSMKFLQELKNNLFKFEKISIMNLNTFIQEWYDSFILQTIEHLEEKLKTLISKEEKKITLTRLVTCLTTLFNMILIYHEGYFKLNTYMNIIQITKRIQLTPEDLSEDIQFPTKDYYEDIKIPLSEIGHIHTAQSTLKEKYACSQEKLQNLLHKI